VKSVSFQFYSVESAIKGSLKASMGNKYYMTVPDRTVVCDGKNIWNYSKDEKKVVISQFEENTSSFSIDNFFFSFLNGYRPVNYYKENSSAKGSGYVLEMEPINKTPQSIQINRLKLWVDTGLNIKKVEILTPQSPQTWEISNFQINPTIAKKVFSFTAPKDCEVIDLR
jgi:outer membrane lipoprotein-sorting protein